MGIENFEEITPLLEELDQLEKYLIEYEKSINSGSLDLSLIHVIFRNAHNLKSQLNLCEETELADIMHLIENNMDLVRNGYVVSTKLLMDVVLEAIDIIRTGLSNKNKNQTKELNLIKTFLTQTSNQKQDNKLISQIDFKLKTDDEKKYLDAVTRKENVYLIEKIINTNISQKDFENLPIYEDIKDCGQLICVNSTYYEMDQKKNEFILKLLISSLLDENELSMKIFDPFKIIHRRENKKKMTVIHSDHPKFNEIKRMFSPRYEIESVSDALFESESETLICMMNHEHMQENKDYKILKSKKKNVKLLILFLKLNHEQTIEYFLKKYQEIILVKPKVLKKENDYVLIFNFSSDSNNEI